jgi:hypothetical protein
MLRERTQHDCQKSWLTPLNTELNPIRHLLALVGARHIVHVSRVRVNWKPEWRQKRGRPRRTWEDGIYIELWVKEISGQANGTIEGNGAWTSEGVVRRFKTALYMYIYTNPQHQTHTLPFCFTFLRNVFKCRSYMDLL